jgi:hypothetical protein
LAKLNVELLARKAPVGAPRHVNDRLIWNRGAGHALGLRLLGLRLGRLL